MPENAIDVRNIYSLTDFLRNYKAHIAHLKDTRTPEVLTVNGRAELVMLDTESYQNLVERARSAEAILAIRSIISQSKEVNQEQTEAITPEEFDRRSAIMDELTAETERLGLYR